MKVAIAGGHGKIGMRLTRLLTERGDEVQSLIRDPGHAEDVRAGPSPSFAIWSRRPISSSRRGSAASTRSSSPLAPDRAAGPSGK